MGNKSKFFLKSLYKAQMLLKLYFPSLEVTGVISIKTQEEEIGTIQNPVEGIKAITERQKWPGDIGARRRPVG